MCSHFDIIVTLTHLMIAAHCFQFRTVRWVVFQNNGFWWVNAVPKVKFKQYFKKKIFFWVVFHIVLITNNNLKRSEFKVKYFCLILCFFPPVYFHELRFFSPIFFPMPAFFTNYPSLFRSLLGCLSQKNIFLAFHVP